MPSISQRYNRNVSPAKKSNLDNLAVIIPAAGIGSRMKAHGPKCLLQINKEDTILDRQIRLVKTRFPAADIVVVTGFKADNVIEHAHKRVRFVINPEYETSNIAYSIYLGTLATTKSNLLILHGDLVFNEQLLNSIEEPVSTLWADEKGLFDKDQIGIVFENAVTNLSFAAESKWIHAVLLCDKDAAMFTTLTGYSHNKNLFLYEILNIMINRHVKFKLIQNNAIRAKDINSIDDLSYVKRITS